MIEIWVDGASVPNPGNTGIGVVIKYPDGRWCKFGEATGHGTNNTAELMAIRAAIRVARKQFASMPIRVISDSQYAVNAVMGRASVNANAGLVEEVRGLMHGVTAIWERRDSSKGNRTANDLANAAASGRPTEMMFGVAKAVEPRPTSREEAATAAIEALARAAWRAHDPEAELHSDPALGVIEVDDKGSSSFESFESALRFAIDLLVARASAR